jgi:hypothetical protein
MTVLRRWLRLPIVARADYDRVLADLEDAEIRIERAWERCHWESSTKAEIAATLLPEVSEALWREEWNAFDAD